MAKKKAEGFEDHLGVLERIVEELESGELTLDASLLRYQEGVKRLQACHEILRAAERSVKILVEGADGEPVEQPLDGDDEGGDEDA